MTQADVELAAHEARHAVQRTKVEQVLDGVKPANTAPVRVDIVPGTKTRYSGGGTTIVQLMLVNQLKKDFPQIMRETVLAPLGLKHSTYEQPLPPALASMAASGTYANGVSVEGPWHVYPEMGAAGLWTTPSGLARIAIEVSKARAGRSARVVSHAMAKQVLTKQSEDFGLGFQLGTATASGTAARTRASSATWLPSRRGATRS